MRVLTIIVAAGLSLMLGVKPAYAGAWTHHMGDYGEVFANIYGELGIVDWLTPPC